jgi:murein L,D-transpeptidase YcbB/YkuD
MGKENRVPLKAKRALLDPLLAEGKLLLVVVSLLLGNAPPAYPRPDSRGNPQSIVSDALDQAGADRLPGTAAPGEPSSAQSVYAHLGLTLLWSTQGSPTEQAVELIDILQAADQYGLRSGDYAVDLIAAMASRLGPASLQQDRARFDLLLTEAAVRLISHLHYGRVDPRMAGFELVASRADLDVSATVATLVSATHVGEAITAAEPPFYHYALLKTALARYRGLAADASLTQLPSFGRHTLHAGDIYAGAPALRRLLSAEGDLSDAGDPGSESDQSLDAGLIKALVRFQSRHGLSGDGTLGNATFVELTTPLAQRVRQIELTLERWRWLPAFDSPPIVVNIPEFRLFAFSATADRVARILQMPVIVGQTYPSKRTPVFVGDLKYVVFRPYWDVPRSITLSEMLPQIRAHADYLERNHLEIVRGESDDSPVESPTPATISALAAGKLRLRQRPGDDNALGLIKFLFPNAHNVYMHSTPAHNLFLAARRAFSHGCIRVSDPVALAAYVLRNTDSWDVARIDQAMHGERTFRVEVAKPIHVMILYGTAMATEAGPVQFFDDIYGHDRKLEALLGLQPVAHAIPSI